MIFKRKRAVGSLKWNYDRLPHFIFGSFNFHLYIRFVCFDFRDNVFLCFYNKLSTHPHFFFFPFSSISLLRKKINQKNKSEPRTLLSSSTLGNRKRFIFVELSNPEFKEKKPPKEAQQIHLLLFFFTL